MKIISRVMRVSACLVITLAGLAGCQSKPHGPGEPMIASGHGQSPLMPNMRMTSSDGSYDYVLTARREIDGSQAYPLGKQTLDLGHGQAGGSSARLQLEKGFAVFGGCFPVAPDFKPDRDAGMLPRPWPVVAVANAAIGAEGTKFSVYVATNANGTDKCQYVFKHSGGPVHAWTYAPGTDPAQATSQIVSIPRNETSPTYLLIAPDAAGVWKIERKPLPDPMSLEEARRYFDACAAVANNAKIPYPLCVIPDKE